MSLILDGTNGLSDVDGSAATPAIRGSDANTGVFFDSDVVGLSTDGTERVRVDASGNVGIGTSSPSYPLHIVGNTNGNVTSGVTNSNSGTDAFARFLAIADAGNAQFGMTSSGYTGITGAQDALVLNANSASGGIAFALDGVLKSKIDSSGNLLVGTTTQSGNARVTIAGGSIVANAPTSSASGTYSLNDNGSSPNTIRFYNNTDSNNTGNRFVICDAGASVLRAEIRSNGGLANFSANNVNLSDRREKTNFAPANSYLDTICAIPVQTFNYIDQNMEEDPGLTLGVVAQDVQAVAPELVMESNWGTKEDPKMRLSVYQTDLQYALMKCIQEQQAIITALTARVEALEGAQA